MKWLAIPLMIIPLAACQDDREKAVSDLKYNYLVECIDGVEYWIRLSGYMAPRVDPETLTFVRCEGN